MARSIRHQLTLIICSLIVLVLTVALVMSYYFVAKDYEEKMQQTNLVMAESLGNNIAQFMQNAYNINAMIAQSPDIKNFDEEKQGQLLVNIASQYPFFQLLAIHHLNGDQSARSSGTLANRSERWWFKKFMRERKDYISKTYYSLFSESPITTINHGVYKDGQLVGLLMADIETSKIQQMVENYSSGAGSYAYLLDSEGVVIAHPDRQQVANLYNYKNMKASVLLRDENGNIVHNERNNERTQDIDFSVPPSLQVIVNKVTEGETGVGEYTDLNGDTYICAYRTILLPGHSDPWSLIVVQKKSAALVFLYHTTIKNGVIGIVITFLAGLVTLLFSRRLTNPLIEIVNATNKIKEGDLTIRLTVDSLNEIGILAINFNQMVSELQQHRDRLQELVEERTGELGAANQELTAMNEEIIAMNETLEDTNEQLCNENKLRQKIEENLLLRERQYRATTSLLTRPVEEFEGLLESILQGALQLVNAPDGYIALYDDLGKGFCTYYGSGICEHWIKSLVLAESEIVRRVYHTGEIVAVDDYKEYPNRLDDQRLENVASVIMLPLKHEDQVKGILCASWRNEIHFITTEDVKVLRQFCDLGSVAIERTNIHKKIHQMAFYDALTGLPNRESLQSYMTKELKMTHGSEIAGAILFVDIDDLKSVNDSFGHSCGDGIINTVAKHIMTAVGRDVFVARSGGDEFSIVLSGEENRENIAKIADNILEVLCQEYEVAMEHLHMSVSIGVALYPGDSDNVEELIKKADSAMYAAKRAGRSCWRFYEPVFFQETYEKMMLTNGLRRGLERGELSLAYQPQLNITGDDVIGFEALLRWNSSEHGFVSPVRFIPLAEQSGLILPIGQWVVREACQFARRLANMGKDRIHVAVNISPKQLLAEDFVESIYRNIQEAGIGPEQIEIEMTESVLIESLEESILKLNQLRDLGITISLDDFGTGYSSLTYLRSLPVGVLKIDKSFIDQIITDKTQLQVFGTIINLGHTLGLTIVAEGVETKEQLSLLEQFQCDRIQGYIFSPAIPEDEAIEFLVRN
ncbi:EAL domain-containing protein [Pelosinus sp. sgz500959]|uniref:EAL domain-containing protein n=1 Tax=Pelosinus sp. sgz500959 TaxID=3242472 RepID=UPI00366C9E31